MIKKNFRYIVLMMLLVVNKPSFCMHRLIFRGVQLASAGYCIRKGVHKAYRIDEGMRLELSKLEPVREKNVLKWFDEETKKMGIANVQAIYGEEWANEREHILISRSDSRELNFVLPYTQNLKRYHQAIQDRSDAEKEIKAIEDSYFYSTIGKMCGYDQDHYKKYLSFHDDMIEINKRLVDKYHEIVPRETAILKHELGHRENGDTERRRRAMVGIPIIIQAISSGSTYCFNKMCGIKTPQTIGKTLLRSSLAVGSIPLKLAANFVGYNLLCRYQEARADDFAIKNAETKAELEALRDAFRQEQNEIEKKLLFTEPLELAKDMREDLEVLPIRKMMILIASHNLQDLAQGEYTKEQKDRWLRVGATAVDIRHPYLGDRIAKQQKHIDNWDAEHKEA